MATYELNGNVYKISDVSHRTFHTWYGSQWDFVKDDELYLFHDQYENEKEEMITEFRVYEIL